MRILSFFGLVAAPALVLAGCMHTPTESTETPKTSIQSSSSAKTEKIESVEAVIHRMPHDGMNAVRETFPDLKLVKNITKTDHENLSAGMSEESWEYSAEHDVTVVVCTMLNTPAHIFQGKTMSEEDLSEAKMMMKEMMNMMDDMGEMDDVSDMHEMMEEMADSLAPEYLDYSAEKMAELKGDSKFVLFFHANWCPTCRNWEKRVLENLASLPSGTIILKADYDTEADLKKEFEIRVQSTAVFFNADGSVESTKPDPSVDALKDFFS